MKTMLFTVALLTAFCATGLAENTVLSVHNPSKNKAVVKVIGPTPAEKSIPASKKATFRLKTGIYRLRIMLAIGNDAAYLQGPLLFMPESDQIFSWKIEIKLPDLSNQMTPWRQIDQAVFSAENKTDAMEGLESVEKLLQLVNLVDDNIQGSKKGYGMAMAVVMNLEAKGIYIKQAVKAIEGASNRDSAIRELKTLAEENAPCRNIGELQVMHNVLTALGQFGDRAEEVEPILSKYSSSAQKGIADKAGRELKIIRAAALKQPVEKDK